MIEKHLLKIRTRFNFSEEEERILRDAMASSRRFEADEIIVPEGETVGFSSLLIDGFTCRSKYLENGKRQIMEINVPGDFVDMHSYPLGRLDHSVTSLSPCEIVKLPHESITEMIRANLRLGRIFWFFTMVDASIHREWLVSVGRRSALARLAHLICEMFYRLRLIEMTDGPSYHFPITQTELAEVLGLTPIHVNRMLKELREGELVTFRGKKVTIENLPGLEKAADFNPAYLYLQPPKQ